jgi:hypothetical protein
MTAVLGFLAGAAIEVVNTFTRKWTVERLHDAGSVGWILGGLLFRLLGTSVVLALAFRFSVPAGVGALLGYMASRWVMVWWIHRQMTESSDA